MNMQTRPGSMIHLQTQEQMISDLRRKNAKLTAQLDAALESLSVKNEELQRLQALLAVSRLALPDDMQDGRPIRKIVDATLEAFPGISVAEVIGPRRTRRLVRARKACMLAVYVHRQDLSSTQIAAFFNRDHTTVLYAVGATQRGREALKADMPRVTFIDGPAP